MWAQEGAALVLAAIALLCVAGGAGAAYATGAGSTSPSVIVGCAKNQNGQLRIVSEASQCLASESAVTFAAPRASGPVLATVDCAAGQSLQQAIDTSDTAQPLTITIKGTCAESVFVARDDLTLQAASPGDGISAPDGSGPALAVIGRNVSLQSLTLAAKGAPTLTASNGGTIQASGDHIVGDVGADQSANIVFGNVVVDHCNGVQATLGSSLFIDAGSIDCGVKAMSGGSVRMLDGTVVTGSRFQGVTASNGGSVVIDGATISAHGNFGVVADQGTAVVEGDTTLVTGSVFAGVQAVNGGSATVANGAQVSGNGIGLLAANGGHLILSSDGGGGAFVENNTGDGIRIVGASSLQFGGLGAVTGNGGNGISLSDTSVGQFGNSIDVSGNHGFGIHCDGPPSVAMIRGDTSSVGANGSGAIQNCQNAGGDG